jgi:peptide/nickel transport system permease protein
MERATAVDARPDGGRTWLAFVLPGAPQILEKRWGLGGCVVMVWLGGLGVLGLRWRAVLDVGGYSMDEWVALTTLVLGLVLAWGWSVTRMRTAESPARAEPSPWDEARTVFGKNRLAVAGLLAIVAIYLAALWTPYLAPYDPMADDLTRRLMAPSGDHLLGTDEYGRDVLSRLLFGARISLSIGLVAVAISVTIGTILGAVAGYIGGWVDGLIMRLVDLVISFPSLVLLVTVVALFQPSLFVIIVVLGLTQWPGATRLVRGEVLSLREREFVLAARALGFSRARIIARHLLPNVLATVIVVATLGIGQTIVLEAGLSFLGLGVQSPTPSWGTMVNDGRDHLTSEWWLSTVPGLAIVFTVLAFNVVGDGLRDALDPRMRG